MTAMLVIGIAGCVRARPNNEAAPSSALTCAYAVAAAQGFTVYARDARTLNASALPRGITPSQVKLGDPADFVHVEAGSTFIVRSSTRIAQHATMALPASPTKGDPADLTLPRQAERWNTANDTKYPTTERKDPGVQTALAPAESRDDALPVLVWVSTRLSARALAVHDSVVSRCTPTS